VTGWYGFFVWLPTYEPDKPLRRNERCTHV
jgi:hypothetical protein